MMHSEFGQSGREVSNCERSFGNVEKESNFSMPHVPYWIHQLPAALAELEQLSVELIDRAALQRLLGIRKTEAWSLLKRWGGQPLGGALVLPRDQLREALLRAQENPWYSTEPSRHARVQQLINQARRERDRARALVPIAVDEIPELLGQTFAGLPKTIRVGAGRIEIACTSAEDALRQLLELAQAIGNEYGEFERLLFKT